MTEKFLLRLIRRGKTQHARLFQCGFGMAGEVVVIQAAPSVRYQLVNMVTLISLCKLQLMRAGEALHQALTSGGVEAPDLDDQAYVNRVTIRALAKVLYISIALAILTLAGLASANVSDVMSALAVSIGNVDLSALVRLQDLIDNTSAFVI